MNKYLLVILMSLNALSSSAQAKNNPLHRQWMMTKMDKFTKAYLVEKKASITLRDIEGFATMGCNNISFGYDKLKGGKLKFKNGVMTEMACTDMELEGKFLGMLDRTFKYKIKGHKLILTNEKGISVEFIAADWD